MPAGISTVYFQTLFYYTDTMAPVITSCPEYIYVYENERVQLPRPTFYDNVGIYKESKNDIYDKEYFQKGLYFAVYRITDYEGNTATCKVKVHVSIKSGNYFMLNELSYINYLGFIFTEKIFIGNQLL